MLSSVKIQLPIPCSDLLLLFIIIIQYRTESVSNAQPEGPAVFCRRVPHTESHTVIPPNVLLTILCNVDDEILKTFLLF